MITPPNFPLNAYSSIQPISSLNAYSSTPLMSPQYLQFNPSYLPSEHLQFKPAYLPSQCLQFNPTYFPSQCLQSNQPVVLGWFYKWLSDHFHVWICPVLRVRLSLMWLSWLDDMLSSHWTHLLNPDNKNTIAWDVFSCYLLFRTWVSLLSSSVERIRFDASVTNWIVNAWITSFEPMKFVFL